MTKTKIAVAVAGVMAAPFALAQTSTVTLYGRANLGLDHYQATGNGADFKGRLRVYDTGSRLGVRGIEDLGGGLRAVFQIESGLSADTGNRLGQGGQTNTSAGFLASRPSWVGLDGAFGRVLWGRQDVWWGNGTIAQTAASYTNSEVPWTTGSNGRVGAGVARQSNVMSYTTPTFGGFNASLYWSPDTGVSGAESVTSNPATVTFTNNEVAQSGDKVDARLLGLTARWAGGPVSFQYDGVQKKTASDQFVDRRPQNDAHKVGLGFRYAPGGQISVVGSRITNKDSVGTDDLKQSTLTLNWEHVFGNIQALAQFGQTGKVSGCTGANVAAICDNSKSTGIMVGGRYLASKRTAVYLTFNQIRNQNNATADYTGGGYTSAVPISGGADPRIIALGVIHNF